MYKKWYIVQNSKHVPHFLPLQLMRLLFLICSQDENVQEYKRAKKVQDFPLPLAAKCLYGQQKENLGLRAALLELLRSPRSSLYCMCYPNVISRVLGPRTQSRVTGSNPPCLGEKKNSLVLLSCHRSKLSWRKPS